jgi:hypothetical protein
MNTFFDTLDNAKYPFRNKLRPPAQLSLNITQTITYHEHNPAKSRYRRGHSVVMVGFVGVVGTDEED